MKFFWRPPRFPWIWDEPTVEYGALLRLPKFYIDVDRAKADLRVRNEIYWKTVSHGYKVRKGLQPFLDLWLEGERYLYVPRHYTPTWVRLPPLNTISHLVAPPGRLGSGMQHSIILRNEVQREASKALQSGRTDKIISLACGRGKTVVALHAAAEGRRLPALIVVPTNALLDQWVENRDEEGRLIGGIKKFYGLKDREIGHIQGPYCRWEGLSIAVAMLHSLVLKQYPQEFYDYWNVVVFDECHHLGAELFSKATSMFRGERWGLSATVKREDGMDKVFKLHLGDVAYQNLDQPLKPKVYFVHTSIRADLNRFMIRRSGRINMAQLTTFLSEHEERNGIIIGWVTRMARAKRTVLVLGERLSQLHWMEASLQEHGIDAKVHVGAMDTEERREALRHRVVLATRHIAREALDRPAFDTLAILTAHGGEGRMQQELGRILRVYEGKQDPYVFVFEDDISVMIAQTNKMRKYFRKEGLEIKEAG